MEVALDYALQCSPDHPWVREHPEWFHHRPDGTIATPRTRRRSTRTSTRSTSGRRRTPTARALWDACKDILEFWIGHGVRIFRVDNPHTKPLAFWEWVIPAVQAEHPDVLFLAEAFTRPTVMAKLAEVGFTPELHVLHVAHDARRSSSEYLERAVPRARSADYMRPNFWPNTPDILAGPAAQRPAGRVPAAAAAGGHPGAVLRRSTAATSCCENEPASEANEEYLHSEKYELKARDWHRPGSLAPFITRLNDIRRRHPAFAELRNIRFHHGDNDAILAYVVRRAATPSDGGDVVLCVVNLDPDHGARGHARARPGRARPRPCDAPFEAHDELTGATYVWTGADPYVRLDPGGRARATSSTCTGRSRPCMSAARRRDDRWYQRAVFYEVLVRGFYDSNGDGTGDLRGPHREARLPRVARASTASGCCPSTSRRCATAATTSATSSPCCPSTATSATPSSSSRRPTGAASASSPTW